ncbi:PQQ-binding-like beta-propeller repeat protein [Verrucomicrobiales bacterium]|jgi:outer membrane protein assembly factor BamB|nr:PQQ-binding-like beta-propeller repeat protein [Verrucomicrobiales bacterium]
MKLALSLLLLTSSLILADENWPQFRGPTGDGIAHDANIATEWGEDKSIAWKTEIHGLGWSSPVIFGDQVWLTTATPDGKELSALCLDKETGKVLFDKKLFDVAEPQFAHKFNTYASPTPVIEEGRVYLTWGSPGTACLDTTTFKVLWTREDIECDHFRGAGSSPILYGGLIILPYDGADVQFVLAMNKETGKTVWKTKRSVDFKDLDEDGKPKADGDLRKGYATPHIVTLGGKEILISQGAKAIYGYDPKTGEEIWRYDEHSNHSASTRPVIFGETVYAPTGFSKPWLIALSGTGNGVLEESSVQWKLQKGVPKKPSLQLVGDHIYAISDGGIGTCWDAKTGDVKWAERIGGNYSSSPIVANGNLYFCSEEGKTTVIKASPEYEKVAENTIGDGFMASPAVSGDALYLRSRTHLYCIRK